MGYPAHQEVGSKEDLEGKVYHRGRPPGTWEVHGPCILSQGKAKGYGNKDNSAKAKGGISETFSNSQAGN